MDDDQELMAMMADAGFDAVFIGIETPNEASLAECGKGQNIHRDLIRDVKRIQGFGIQVQGGFIVGFDSDDTGIFTSIVEFIQKSGIATAESLMALIRSIIRLGILGKERFHYWKLFFWTLFKRPRAMPLAVTLAIYGYHFRRICELRVLSQHLPIL